MSTLTINTHILARKPYLVAIFISLLLVLWMVSGQLQADDTTQAVAPESQKESPKALPPAQVQVTTFNAVPVAREITLYGRTEPDRQATLKAQVKGLITKVLVKRGARVSQNQPLVQLARNDLDARQAQAEARLAQRRIEYAGAQSLNLKGYQGKANLAASKANLSTAEAELEKIRLDIGRTMIRAPFPGVLNERYVEVGDYVGIGDRLALIVDLDPLVVKADVTEAQVHRLKNGQTAAALMLDKTRHQGDIRYISSLSHEGTNTFKIEVALANPDYALRAGFSTELSIFLDKVPAIKVSPALLTLDEKGNIGIKTVVDDKVVFTPIQMVKSQSDGVWLTGMGQQAKVISLGQGLVREGDPVTAVYAGNSDNAGRL